MDLKTARDKAKDLINDCESPTEKALLYLVQLPTPYTFVAVLLWTAACVAFGYWLGAPI